MDFQTLSQTWPPTRRRVVNRREGNRVGGGELPLCEPLMFSIIKNFRHRFLQCFLYLTRPS